MPTALMAARRSEMFISAHSARTSAAPSSATAALSLPASVICTAIFSRSALIVAAFVMNTASVISPMLCCQLSRSSATSWVASSSLSRGTSTASGGANICAASGRSMVVSSTSST